MNRIDKTDEMLPGGGPSRTVNRVYERNFRSDADIVCPAAMGASPGRKSVEP